MIYNIVDRRKNSYAWGKVWGVVEPSWHDNSIDGATQAPKNARSVSVADFGPAMFHQVTRWAASFAGAMTLYVYDKDPMRPVDPTIAAEDPA